MIEINVEIHPVAKERPRRSRNGHFYTPPKTAKFESMLATLIASNYDGGPLAGPLKLECTFVIQRPKTVKRDFPFKKPDLDNYVKALMDSINLASCIWTDDAQVVSLQAQKEYGPLGRIRFCVSELV